MVPAPLSPWRRRCLRFRGCPRAVGLAFGGGGVGFVRAAPLGPARPALAWWRVVPRHRRIARKVTNKM